MLLIYWWCTSRVVSQRARFQWRGEKREIGVSPLFPFLSVLVPSFYFLFFILSFSFLFFFFFFYYFRSRTLKIQLGFCGRAVSSLAGPGPQPRSNLMHYSFEIWYLVARILVICLRINWTNWQMQFKRMLMSCLMEDWRWGWAPSTPLSTPLPASRTIGTNPI